MLPVPDASCSNTECKLAHSTDPGQQCKSAAAPEPAMQCRLDDPFQMTAERRNAFTAVDLTLGARLLRYRHKTLISQTV